MFEVEAWNLEHHPEVGVIARSNELGESDAAISDPAKAVKAASHRVAEEIMDLGEETVPVKAA